MLASVAPPTNDFHALARYLVHGKTKPTHPDRVAWTLAHNLPTDDPEQAAALMSATAGLSKRTQNAAYHLMIAWHERERPTPETMQEIARKTLEMADLGEHQALIMGHGDTPHRHLHMLINRVHPTTGKAWKTSHDFARFDAIMRQLSEDYGFEYVPTRTYSPDETDERPTKPNSRATYAAKRGASTGRLQWSKAASRTFGRTLSEQLDQAATWDDLTATVAEHGLTFEAKGRGYVIGNAGSYTKFSALGLTTSAKEFEKRFGPPRTPLHSKPARKRRPVFSVDAIDIAKAFVVWGLASKDAVRRAVDDVKRERANCLAAAPLAKRLMRELAQSLMATTSLTPRRISRPSNRQTIPVAPRPKIYRHNAER